MKQYHHHRPIGIAVAVSVWATVTRLAAAHSFPPHSTTVENNRKRKSSSRGIEDNTNNAVLLKFSSVQEDTSSSSSSSSLEDVRNKQLILKADVGTQFASSRFLDEEKTEQTPELGWSNTADDTMGTTQPSPMLTLKPEAAEEEEDSSNKPARNAVSEPCDGMFMTMFMDGFHWSFVWLTGTSSSSPSSCLNYMLPSWKLDTASKFRGAMLFTFLLALLTETVSAMRRSVVRSLQHLRVRRRDQLHVDNSNNTHNHQPPNSFAFGGPLLLLVLYAVQALLGYILMIVAMSFSIELVGSIIAGVSIGHALFGVPTQDDDEDEHPCESNNNRSPPHQRQVLLSPNRNGTDTENCTGCPVAATDEVHDEDDDNENGDEDERQPLTNASMGGASLRRR